MIDTTLVALGYAFLAVAAVAIVAAVAGLVIAVRELRAAPAPAETPAVPPCEFSRAA
ncbi:hypothetical protein KM427_03500 [Nocardioides sp. LMS-CY]|uniref:hypothetical protein n=1 Tax=Nocardioides sp. (strain LMS-CY) TaxID=2840457 RepID=UPI001BFFE841|nr:hypothetical protein [Nocardioides sp. LMS-CY]QWF22819.1 hypothetical protein KM427_03500 [Nocardioides sp. LMS-CY]